MIAEIKNRSKSSNLIFEKCLRSWAFLKMCPKKYHENKKAFDLWREGIHVGKSSTLIKIVKQFLKISRLLLLLIKTPLKISKKIKISCSIFKILDVFFDDQTFNFSFFARFRFLGASLKFSPYNFSQSQSSFSIFRAPSTIEFLTFCRSLFLKITLFTFSWR